jgi:hypothetical protein
MRFQLAILAAATAVAACTPKTSGDTNPASDGHVAPTAYRVLSETEKAELLAARDKVWRDVFANDKAEMAKALPAHSVFINADAPRFSTVEQLNADMDGFVAAGGKLTRLEFPRTEFQAFGDVVILYTTYAYDLEIGGEVSTASGHATEVFVKENGVWTNPGWHLDNY